VVEHGLFIGLADISLIGKDVEVRRAKLSNQPDQ